MKVPWPSLLQQYSDGQTVLWFWRMIFIFLKRKIWILGLRYTERATPSHERLCICTKVSWARFPLSVAFVPNQNNYIIFWKCLMSLVDLLTENSFGLSSEYILYLECHGFRMAIQYHVVIVYKYLIIHLKEQSALDCYKITSHSSLTQISHLIFTIL